MDHSFLCTRRGFLWEEEEIVFLVPGHRPEIDFVTDQLSMRDLKLGFVPNNAAAVIKSWIQDY